MILKIQTYAFISINHKKQPSIDWQQFIVIYTISRITKLIVAVI
jgi:hypothetical protein